MGLIQLNSQDVGKQQYKVHFDALDMNLIGKVKHIFTKPMSNS